MQVRLAFSTSFQVDADLLLFDEVLAVGDEVFKRKCMLTFERLIERGHTIVYVTHALDTVQKFADRVLLLEEGRAVALGEPDEVLEEYERRNLEHERARRAAPATESEVDVPSYPEAPLNGSGLRRFVDITLTLARAEFKLRYLNSIVGYVWSLAQPLLLFLVLYFFWVELFHPGAGVPHYELALLLGVALFTFFSEAAGHALNSLVGKGAMLRKIPFSPLTLPISSVLTSFYVYGLTLVIAIGFIFASGIPPRLAWLEMVPVLALLLVYTIGVSLLLALLYVSIRDVEPIWTVIQRLMFFLTPVFYPIELAPDNLEKILMLNPLSVVTVEARHILVDPSAPSALDVAGPGAFAASLAITATVLGASLLLYRKQAALIAERI
jgi:ABC-2 type transport system permease protein